MNYFFIVFDIFIFFLVFRYHFIMREYNKFYDRITEIRQKYLYDKRLRQVRISTHEEIFKGLIKPYDFIVYPKYWTKWKITGAMKDKILLPYIETLEIVAREEEVKK